MSRGEVRSGAASAGVTLVEVLVVAVVVGLLVGLLIPAVHGMRATARRTQCLGNLHEIGMALDQFLDIRRHSGRYPEAATLPSLTPDRPSLAEILSPYMDGNAAFCCPADSGDFFQQEGLSYEYPAQAAAGKTRRQYLRGRPPSQVWILYDFDTFHGPPGEEGARNFLYVDGHAGI